MSINNQLSFDTKPQAPANVPKGFRSPFRAATMIPNPPNRGYLLPVSDGWVLYTALGSARAVLRVSHGWTEQTAQEALSIQEGDVLL